VSDVALHPNPLVVLLVLLLGMSLSLWVAVRVARKAGFSGWWSLTLIIPLVNLLVIYWFAYVSWPRIDSEERRAG
jgi:hypothetical protein